MNSSERRPPGQASKNLPACDSSDSVVPAATVIENDRKKKRTKEGTRPTDSTRRLERKRRREKKRRQDVNQGLEELQNILVQVNPAIKAGREQSKKILQLALGPRRAGATTDDTATINRADLLQYATSAIKRLSQENQQQKLLIQQLARMTMIHQNGSGSTTGLALLRESKIPLDEPPSGLGRTFNPSVTGRQALTDSSLTARLCGKQQSFLQQPQQRQQQRQRQRQQQQQQHTFLGMRQAPTSDNHTITSFPNEEETSLLQAQLMQAQLESARSRHLIVESLGLSTQQTSGFASNQKSTHPLPSSLATTTEQAQRTNIWQQRQQECEQEEEEDSSDDALRKWLSSVI